MLKQAKADLLIARSDLYFARLWGNDKLIERAVKIFCQALDKVWKYQQVLHGFRLYLGIRCSNTYDEVDRAIDRELYLAEAGNRLVSLVNIKTRLGMLRNY